MNSHIKNVGKGLAKTALYSAAGAGLGIVANRAFYSKSFKGAWDLSKHNVSKAKGSFVASMVVAAISIVGAEYLKDSLE